MESGLHFQLEMINETDEEVTLELGINPNDGGKFVLVKKGFASALNRLNGIYNSDEENFEHGDLIKTFSNFQGRKTKLCKFTIKKTQGVEVEGLYENMDVEDVLNGEVKGLEKADEGIEAKLAMAWYNHDPSVSINTLAHGMINRKEVFTKIGIPDKVALAYKSDPIPYQDFLTTPDADAQGALLGRVVDDTFLRGRESVSLGVNINSGEKETWYLNIKAEFDTLKNMGEKIFNPDPGCELMGPEKFLEKLNYMLNANSISLFWMTMPVYDAAFATGMTLPRYKVTGEKDEDGDVTITDDAELKSTVNFLRSRLVYMAILRFTYDTMPRLANLDEFQTIVAEIEELGSIPTFQDADERKRMANDYVSLYNRSLAPLALEAEWYLSHIDGLDQMLTKYVMGSLYFAKFRNSLKINTAYFSDMVEFLLSSNADISNPTSNYANLLKYSDNRLII
jgi:hypothetical protein